MVLHTFGDSHSTSGWQFCDNVITHHLGPILCYSFGKEKLNRCDLRNFNIRDGDSVVFCFGEIDCRCHIHKHITNENSYVMIIDDIINNYIEAIKEITDTCGVKLKNICIYNVVPPIEKHNVWENPAYPYLGSDEERKKYVLYFNKCLKEKCRENNWFFIDIYDYYIDNNGFLNKKYSDGNVHISNGIFLKNFLINNNLS
jgi:hypothetical protein